jgi:hypothetical protein
MRDTSATPEARLPQPKLLATYHLPLATVLNVLLAILLPGCFLVSASAQTETATVAGRVSDSSGAVVPSASLRLVNIDKGTETDTKTNGNGLYVISGVQPGRYRIEVGHDGFKVANLTGLTVNVQDNLEENFKLEVGSVSESVTVSAEGNNINTTDGSVSTVIDRDFVANIPLNGRSFQDLISLTPGVVTASPQADSGQSHSTVTGQGDFSVNGQRTESNNYIVDGVSGNTSPGLALSAVGSMGASTVLGTTQSLLSVDALQEFRVESSTYSAEYGGAPGGQFSFVSRSGTDSFHGSLFEYLRNDALDANDWFNDYLRVAKPALRQNDFGGTVGGPVRIPKIYDGKDKTFFFFSYEGLRLIQPTEASQQYVPSLSLRASAASVLQPILNAFPQPTAPEVQIACDNVTYQCAGQPLGTIVPSGLAPFIKAYSSPSSINSTSVRLDHAIGDRVHLFLRAAYTPSNNATRSLSSFETNLGNFQTYTGGADVEVSSSVSDQLRVGYSRAIAGRHYALDTFGGATPTNLAQDLGTCCYPSGANYVYLGFPLAQPAVDTASFSIYQYDWNVNDATTWNVGRHSIKAGVSYRRITSPFTVAYPNVEAGYDSPASVESNSADFLGIQSQIAPSPLYNQFGAFAQDEWGVTSSLHLSVGLRWEVQPPPTSNNAVRPYPLLGNINDPSTYSLGIAGGQLYKTTWGNVAPRFGLAYKVHGTAGAETVVRGGIGIFYDTGLQATASIFPNAVGTEAFSSFSGVPLPLTPAQFALSLSPTPPYSGRNFIANDFKLPYTIEWNVAVQQALGREQNLTLTYVGSNGRRLTEENQLSVGNLNPDFGSIILFQNGLTSNYQGLQVQFQRRLSHGLTALASYTWSHSLDYGSTGGDLGYDYLRGNSDFDVSNSFNGALTWDLPLIHGNALTRAVVDGWGIDSRIFARSGFPVPVRGSFFFNPVTGVGSYAGLDVVPGVPFYVYSSALPGGRAINPQAFTSAAPHSIGDAPRNFLRGFGETQINLAIRREFPLHEDVKLQFRAELFNILNHPNFGYIDPYFGQAQFGQATETLSQSLASVSSLYQQGGARSMQFALKIVF